MIPKLIIVDGRGNVISEKGRKEVEDRGVAAFRSWLNQHELLTKTPAFNNDLTSNTGIEENTKVEQKVRFS